MLFVTNELLINFHLQHLLSMSEVLQVRFWNLEKCHVWESLYRNKNWIVKISRKRCMSMICHIGCLRLSRSCTSFAKSFFFGLIFWMTHQQVRERQLRSCQLTIVTSNFVAYFFVNLRFSQNSIKNQKKYRTKNQIPLKKYFSLCRTPVG